MDRQIHNDADLMGWRARIGLIVPDSLLPTEPWFYRLAPEGVTFLSTRIFLGKIATEETLKKMNENNIRAARELANADVDLIAYCCTSGSFIEGVGYDEKIIKEIEDETGIPATTTTTAFVEALKVLNIKKITLVTPYIEATNLIEKNFLEAFDFEVLGIGTKNLDDIMQIRDTTAAEIYQLTKETDNQYPTADGIFISCMNWKAMDVIQTLEYDTKKPVITANQATLWKILRMTGVNEPIDGYGKLLRSH